MLKVNKMLKILHQPGGSGDGVDVPSSKGILRAKAATWKRKYQFKERQS
jgi:hypothetical protein